MTKSTANARRMGLVSAATAPLAVAVVALTALSAMPAGAKDFDAVVVDAALLGAVSDVIVTVDPQIIEEQRLGHRSFKERNTIGPRDAEDVIEVLDREMSRQFERRGVLAEEAPLTLEVTVTKVRATDLRFTEYGIRNNLAFGSVAAGGADFEARLVTAAGQEVAMFTGGDFETQIDEFSLAGSTWSDARKAARWFSRDIAKVLNEPGVEPAS